MLGEKQTESGNFEGIGFLRQFIFCYYGITWKKQLETNIGNCVWSVLGERRAKREISERGFR